MTNRISTTFYCLVLVAFACSDLRAQDAEVKPFVGTAEEIELIGIIEQFNQQKAEVYRELEKITDQEKSLQYYLENEPALKTVPLLFDFEAKHRGTIVRLMALRQLTKMGISGGPINNPRDMARRRALKYLKDYAEFDELNEIVRYFTSGNFEPEIEVALRSVIYAENATPLCRQYAKLMLANWYLYYRKSRPAIAQHLNRIANNPETQSSLEIKVMTDRLNALPSESVTENWPIRGRELIQSIIDSKSELRQIAFTLADPQRCILTIDRERTKTMPTLVSLAEGILFCEDHLSPTKPAPPLDLELMSGEKWTMTGNLGKVVIIQFSFKGCGPCEEMYPDPKEMQKEFGDKISVLGIMTDEKRETTAESIATGVLTWNVHWDGQRGPIATQWAAQGFPTVYVIDRDGRVAVADSMHGEELRKKVKELVEQ
jgi:thiol-disulfide isomerase/thioredoxin